MRSLGRHLESDDPLSLWRSNSLLLLLVKNFFSLDLVLWFLNKLNNGFVYTAHWAMLAVHPLDAK